MIADLPPIALRIEALASIAVGGDVYGVSEQRPAALQQAEQGLAQELAKLRGASSWGYDEG